MDTTEILVRETLENLEPIKSDLICTDCSWQNWGFENLLQALQDYTLRNLEKGDSNDQGDKSLVTKEKSVTHLQRENQAIVYTVHLQIIETVSVVKSRKLTRERKYSGTSCVIIVLGVVMKQQHVKVETLLGVDLNIILHCAPKMKLPCLT